MDRRIRALRHLPVWSVDGPVGRAMDVLFDDRDWSIRHLVVLTREDLGSRFILVDPSDIEGLDDEGSIHVSFARARAELQPDLESDPPIGSRWEAALSRGALFVPYWGGGPWGALVFPADESPDSAPGQPVSAPDPHLRSFEEVCGYRVRATDRRAGRLRDLVFDDGDWTIRSIEIQLRRWADSDRVLIPPHSVLRISWRGRAVVLCLRTEELRAAPSPAAWARAARGQSPETLADGPSREARADHAPFPEAPQPGPAPTIPSNDVPDSDWSGQRSSGPG